ncbi:hypothetical protein BU23DRAFT_571709 [Bimuria novae-zelandiae CBS 107.79]|uniref:Uncharacterized protein n=1 Tax=Bimuria novae-zelandiae CBS 107.79 TaxID=1447943 RepID=A0A6A5UX15_9PLEO|nr:hypothetical protein BU23DRAFT_571709 [Bimuria novae-zelandiae CBS 107.79]
MFYGETGGNLAQGIFRYFDDKTDYELSVSSRWPRLGSPDSLNPAIVLNVKYDASKYPASPLAKTLRSKEELANLAITLRGVDEICAITGSNPQHDRMDIRKFICETELCSTEASERFINFRREYVEPEGNAVKGVRAVTDDGHEAVECSGEPHGGNARATDHSVVHWELGEWTTLPCLGNLLAKIAQS